MQIAVAVRRLDHGDLVEQRVTRRRRFFKSGRVGKTAAQIVEMAFHRRRAGNFRGERIEL